jgi:hypothetical protein
MDDAGNKVDGSSLLVVCRRYSGYVTVFIGWGETMMVKGDQLKHNK